jgi:hypothetical protein
MNDKKNPIDWPAILADWNKSEWSIRRIAEWYQVSDGAIRKRARAEGWPDRVSIAHKPVRTAPEPKREPVVMAGVDATDPSQIVGRGHNLIFRLLDELDAATTHQGELSALIEAHEDDPRRRAAMMKAIELPGRANVIKALATAFKTWSEAKAPEGKKAQRDSVAKAAAAGGGKFAPPGAPKLVVSNK